MTAKYCNQKCKYCYIDFPPFKKVEDFIETEIIENALKDLSNTKIKCIYLTGAEPMTHPNFNSILRLCLKKSAVCICTNGSFINEKKARFLKKVEEESTNEIFFRISLDHYDEIKNDDIRYRGAYRQAVFAVKHLMRYNFTPIITVTNYYNENQQVLWEGINKLFSDKNPGKTLIEIKQWHDKNSVVNTNIAEKIQHKLDCEYGRTLSTKGSYSCPFLSGDYRGRCGSNFKDYSKNIPLETSFCMTCIKNSTQMFGIN